MLPAFPGHEALAEHNSQGLRHVGASAFTTALHEFQEAITVLETVARKHTVSPSSSHTSKLATYSSVRWGRSFTQQLMAVTPKRPFTAWFQGWWAAIHTNLSICFHNQGQSTRALHVLQQVVAVEDRLEEGWWFEYCPRPTETMINLATVHLGTGQSGKALKALVVAYKRLLRRQHVIGKEPPDMKKEEWEADTWRQFLMVSMNMGVVCEATRSYSSALQCYKYSLRAIMLLNKIMEDHDIDNVGGLTPTTLDSLESDVEGYCNEVEKKMSTAGSKKSKKEPRAPKPTSWRSVTLFGSHAHVHVSSVYFYLLRYFGHEEQDEAPSPKTKATESIMMGTADPSNHFFIVKSPRSPRALSEESQTSPDPQQDEPPPATPRRPSPRSTTAGSSPRSPRSLRSSRRSYSPRSPASPRSSGRRAPLRPPTSFVLEDLLPEEMGQPFRSPRRYRRVYRVSQTVSINGRIPRSPIAPRHARALFGDSDLLIESRKSQGK